ncbi:DNA polymerase family A-domain-containing protein [Glomus cerebriforme]|uniref:DNA-directed DNA polymerase n=1 Tax=Glomus cerebriforme TaxID=658196 RepID=A0A397T2W7_9GLOM|nr:DNA polymerase family A-domain-containing protein [Glomus cerebriforme]
MTHQYQGKYISSSPEDNQKTLKRINDAGVEMLPKWLYEKVFPHSSQQLDQKKVDIALKHLELQGLKGKETEKVPGVPEFDIPELCGNTIAEHFWNIGEHQAKKYRILAEKFADSELLDIPSEQDWVIESGWTRYEHGKDPEHVNFPDEQLLCFDVETLLSKSDYGLIACAASPNAWYTWISPYLIDFRDKNITNNDKNDFKDNKKSANAEKMKINKVLKKEHDADNLNFIKGREIGSLIPMGQIEEGRIIVGHNVSFDRARIKEEYNYNKSDNKFLDTMALHVAVSGLCGRQRSAWIKYNRAEKEKDSRYLESEKDFSSIHDVSSINNLCDVYKLHCRTGSKIDKLVRKEFFVDGTLEEIVIKENLKRLITYCANDVLATFQVFKKVLPRFLQVCPHPVSFAGILEMGSMFLTTSKDWDEYVQNAEEVYQSKRDAIETSLQQLADKAAQAAQGNPELIKDDQWLKQLDWSLPSSRAKKLPGFPMWYRDIYCSKECKVKITSKSLIAPLLLRLKWQDFPLYYSRIYGWMYRVPKDADYQTNAKACEFPDIKDEVTNSDIQLKEEELSLSNKKKQTTKSMSLNNDIKLFANDKDGIYYRIPHKDGEEARCTSPLAKHYIVSFEKGVLSSEHEIAKDALQMNAACSYWVSSRNRIGSQMVVYDDHPEIMKMMGFEGNNEKTIGMIIPQTVTMGTITRRAVEKTWMTASNVKENRIGSELKAIIQAPKGYKIVGADVDSEELWIASLLGDSQFGFHGATAMGWMTLQGNKSAGTDLHSRTASILSISRSDAKVFNYGRIYGAGLKFAVQLLKQFNETIKDSEATKRATALYYSTKGKKYFPKNRKIRKDAFWYGGSESYMFNSLEEIATDKEPKTPVLKCGITDALKENVVNQSYMTSRVNWVVQSSGVDYLHLLIVSMQYLMNKYNIKGRFMLSVHDEVRFLVKEEDSHRAALALQISNFWTRALFSYMLGINDLPLSVAFFSAVDIDHVLRKEAETSCKTISYDTKIEEGQSLTIHELIKLESSKLDKLNQNNNEDYSMKEINDSSLLTPYNNTKSKEINDYLEIQSLSNEEEVKSYIKNSTLFVNNWNKYKTQGYRKILACEM